MALSLWDADGKLPAFNELQGDHKTQVLIIGGGLCGVLCAYFLQEAGVDYMLVEGNTIGSGMTKNTTAKITSQHGLIYHKLVHKRGPELALAYLEANEWALRKYEELSEGIDCDFEKKDAFVYSLKDRRKLEQEMQALERLGFPAELCETVPLPFETCGAVKFPEQAQFHPLKFLASISKGLNIYEHTFIRELKPGMAIYDGGEIYAEQIIIAAHFPFINTHGMYFMKLYQHRSYVLALKGGADLQVHGMYLDEAAKGLSFRNYKEFLYIGGGSHRTGKRGGGWDALKTFAAKYYPDSQPAYTWAAQDCMSLDGIPYIGPYSKNLPGVYVASGFNKWGMTLSMAAAGQLCEAVLGCESSLTQQLFHPARNMLTPQLFLNALETSMNFLTPTTKRCPHLGCALKWNKAEHTWDCPCHGSRFEEHGKLIDNPAMRDRK